MDEAGGSIPVGDGLVNPNLGSKTGAGGTTGPAAPTTRPEGPHAPATHAPQAPVTRGSGGAFKRATTGGANDWCTWWSWNSEPYLRTELVANFAATPGPADVSACDLTPRLAALLVGDDARLVASGLVALARATPASQRERVAALVRTRLDHDQFLVREAAVVALGILRDGESVAPLAARMTDGASVSCSERQLAALALGLIGGSEAEAQLLALLHQRLCPDLASAALIGAAQAAPDSTRVARHAITILTSGASDANARACAAVALSRLRGDTGRAALANLVALARDPGTPGELRASALLALGSLATPADRAATAELARAAQASGDPRPRSLALIALGRIVERDADRANDGAERAPLIGLLLTAALQPGRSADRPWALLALGFALRNESAGADERVAAAEPLRELVASTASPDERAAAAIALGLMGDMASQSVLTGELERRRTSSRLAIALLQGLGMLRASGAVASVRAVAFDAGLRPEVRVEAARTLALLGDPKALPRMAKELETTHDASEAATLCASLAKLRTTAAIDPLALQAFGAQRGQEATRRRAAAALGELTEGGASGSLPFWCAYSIDRDVALRAPILRPLSPE
jgi:HEAT repeat protein